MANKSPYKQRPINDTYKRNLRSWIETEKSKSGLSYRNFVKKFVEITGIELTYGSFVGWKNGKLSNEITDDSLLAIAKYRGEEPEETRAWLFSGSLPQHDEELGRVIAWMKSAPKAMIVTAIKAGLDTLSKEKFLEPEQPLLALKMQQAGVSVERLLEECVLDENEIQLAQLYLEGKISSVSDRIQTELEFAINELTEQNFPRTCADNPVDLA